MRDSVATLHSVATRVETAVSCSTIVCISWYSILVPENTAAPMSKCLIVCLHVFMGGGVCTCAPLVVHHHQSGLGVGLDQARP